MILRFASQEIFDVVAIELIQLPNSGLYLWVGPIPSRAEGDDGWKLRSVNRYHPTIGPSGEAYLSHPVPQEDIDWLETELAEMVSLGLIADGDVSFIGADEVERVEVEE